eukprot:539916-Prymnesium_polylepis.1
MMSSSRKSSTQGDAHDVVKMFRRPFRSPSVAPASPGALRLERKPSQIASVASLHPADYLEEFLESLKMACTSASSGQWQDTLELVAIFASELDVINVDGDQEGDNDDHHGIRAAIAKVMELVSTVARTRGISTAREAVAAVGLKITAAVATKLSGLRNRA